LKQQVIQLLQQSHFDSLQHSLFCDSSLQPDKHLHCAVQNFLFQHWFAYFVCQ
jgi:hypothetical protein